jgi:hypothetical protein
LLKLQRLSGPVGRNLKDITDHVRRICAAIRHDSLGEAKPVRAYRVRLPSGLEVRLRPPPSPCDDDVVDGAPLLFGRTLRVLEREGALEQRRPGRWSALGRAAVRALPLADFHALRDLAMRTGAVTPEPDEGACRNCDAPLALDPRELDPGELAVPPPAVSAAGGPFTLPAALRLPGGAVAREAWMEPVTVERAIPLWRALAKPEPYRITPRLLDAMGVRSVGPLVKPALLARVLGRASDEVWAAFEQRFIELNYAPRIAPLHCPRCGALHEVEVPAPREFVPEQTARASRPSAEPFPSAEAFEALVERIAPEVYAARGVRNVALRVETGVPATDIAGEPLLGSYEPRYEVDTAGWSRVEFLITLYYQTFRRVWEDEGAYDLEREIRETIDHELEHHLHHLAGHDPLDAEERAQARRELRALYGDRRLARMVLREALGDLAAFARATWPFFALIAASVALASWLGLWGP